MKAFLKSVGAIIWKDVKTEWRTRENLSAMLVFSLLVILSCGRPLSSPVLLD